MIAKLKSGGELLHPASSRLIKKDVMVKDLFLNNICLLEPKAATANPKKKSNHKQQR